MMVKINISNLLSLEKLGLNNEKYVLRARYLPQEKDFGITISNRGGMLANAEYKIDPLKSKLNKSVFIQAINFLDYNGDVLMCSHDWGKNILGNLKVKSFSIFGYRKKLNHQETS